MTFRYPDDVPTLTDGVVTLRAACDEDIGRVHEQCTDPTTQRWTTVPVPYTREHAEDFVRRRAAKWADGSDWGFAVETTRTTEAGQGAEPGRFGGSVSIRDRGSGIGEIAFGAHPAVRGRGVMTRAVRLICDWAFATQQMQAIRWRAQVGNMASWRVVWANGFTFEGASRASMPQRGAAVDGWHAALLADDSREPKSRWLKIPRLVGERVVLRPLATRDQTRCLETTNDPDSWHWLSIVPGFPRDADAFAKTLTNAALGPSLGRSVGWAMADPDTDDYLGTLTLFDIGGRDYASAEYGYWAHPDARGRGVTTEAVRLAAGHAFATEDVGGLGLQRLHLGVAAQNLASQSVARKAGFTQTGRDRCNYDLADGAVTDLVRFDQLKSEFVPAPTSGTDRRTSAG